MVEYSVHLNEGDNDDTPMASILTRYHVGENGRVEKVVWQNSQKEVCIATTVDSVSDQYNYSSRLCDDIEAIDFVDTMSLADCILAANVHLGLIPPHNFDTVVCPNQH